MQRSAATESRARRLAERSPRLHGLSVVGIGAGILCGVAVVRMSGFTIPLAEAAAFILIGLGLWSCVTGHTFAEPPERLPGWWRPGAVIAGLLGGVLGFFIRR